MVIDVTDGWLLAGRVAAAGPDPCLHPRQRPRVSLMTAKIGVLLRDIQDAQGAEGWLDHVRALSTSASRSARQGRDRPGQSAPAKPPGADLGQDLVLRDLGWDLGEPAHLPEPVVPGDAEAHGVRGRAARGRGARVPQRGQRRPLPRVQRRRLDLPAAPANPSARPPSRARRACRRRTSQRAAACGSGGCACGSAATSWRRSGCSTASACSSRSARSSSAASGSITDVTRDGHRYREFALGLLLRFRAMEQGLQHRRPARLRPGHRAGRPLHLLAVRPPAVVLPGRHRSSCAASGCWWPAACRPTCPSRAGARRRCGCSTGTSRTARRARSRCAATASQQRGGWKVEQGAEAAGVGADLVPVGEQGADPARRSSSSTAATRGSGLLVAAEVFALKASTADRRRARSRSTSIATSGAR